MTLLLQVQGVTKRFGGLQALTQVTFDLPKGPVSYTHLTLPTSDLV